MLGHEATGVVEAVGFELVNVAYAKMRTGEQARSVIMFDQ